jgi:antitoxin CptB
MDRAVSAELGRLAWRCRRGMKELDLLLTGYLRDRWPLAAPGERAAFERILELPDPLLAAYLMQREAPPDPDLESLLAILRGQVAGRLSDTAAIATPSGPQGS